MNIKRAIISVYDKTNLEDFARFLFENGVEIISTEGTASFLKAKGIDVTKMSDYIDFPEILNGRIKSIDAKLFGGILAKSNDKVHEEDMEQYNIKRIDMVVINFPSFIEMAKKTANEEKLLDYLDIGGFALIRAAAKNYKDVVPLVDPNDYQNVRENLEECGDVPLQLRRKLSLKVFFSSSKYDASIHKVFSELFASEKFDHEFFEILGNLRYGSNPMQEAVLMKFLDKKSFVNNLENLTPYKKPTLRILKDVKILYSLVSNLEDRFLGFSKKGTFVFGYLNPSEEESMKFIDIVKRLKGGVVYCDDLQIIEELKESRHDCLLTSANIGNTEEMLSFKPMVFRVKKELLTYEDEYIIEGDLVIKQNSLKFSPNTTLVEKIAFEVSKNHKSDTIVYVKDNKIYSGNQSCLNREIALLSLEQILELAEETPMGGTMILDSTVNSEKIVERLLEWNIKKIIVPPNLPGYETYVKELENNGVEVLSTSRRYHKY